MGPIFYSEMTTAPRRARFFIARTAYGLLLLLVMATTWLVVQGTHSLRGLGDAARFGETLLAILAPFQLALAIFIPAFATAGAINQEKDRRTLPLLLLTRLTSGELVLGRLSASLAGLLATMAAGLPVFACLPLLGGVSMEQVARVTLVTVATAIVSGSIGALVAFWRETTFQTLALVTLILVAWLAVGEFVAAGNLGNMWAAAISPARALLVAMVDPPIEARLPIVGGPLAGFLLFSLATTLAINTIAIARVRKWNTTAEPWRRQSSAAQRESVLKPEAAQVAPQPVASTRAPRPVWDWPVLWREVATWAFGRKMVIVRAVYLAAFGAAVWGTIAAPNAAIPFVALAVPSLALVNALSVTSITMERDLGALDLLLVTDLTPREVVFGKLAGALYNTKEMILLPVALCGWLWWTRQLTAENAGYVIGTLLALDVFAAVLGLHCGMLYERSRTAITVSLGTLFFLLVGVGLCIAILVAFADPFGNAFTAQLAPFLAFMLGGAIGLWRALSSHRPSAALGLAAILLPLATFWAITSYFLRYTQGVALVVTAAYSFATIAMLLPAVADLDSTIGRNREG
jgi:ABC-type transport system involved in multi-copper enzyme maturation permease subunit